MTPNRNEPKSKFDARGVLMGERKLKSEANYRVADGDSLKRCSECLYYVSPGQPQSDCEKVVGQVESFGTCDLWTENPTPPGDREEINETPTVSVTINMGPGSKDTAPNP